MTLQQALGNQGVTQLLTGPATRGPGSQVLARSAPPVQRLLDEQFTPAGVCSAKELQVCHQFAEIVSGIVDEVHQEFMAGRLSTWSGAKITTFLKLLRAEKPAALVHAGNAIEERVYHRMRAAQLPARWTPQFSEGMGGASLPDIVINLDGDKEGLIDVTSQRGHILGKAGGWTTSARYVYLAEAYFPSVFRDHLPRIKAAAEAGGLNDEAMKQMMAEVAATRATREAAAAQERTEAREFYAACGGTFAALVREAFTDEDGSHRAEAAAWMRKNGMGGYRGVPRKAARRTQSAEQRAKRRKVATKHRHATMSREEKAQDMRRKKEQSERARLRQQRNAEIRKARTKELSAEERKLL